MMENPEKVMEDWLEVGAKRVIVHHEALSGEELNRVLSLAYAYGAELMIALNPETPSEALRSYFSRVKSYQVLSVHPGTAGQDFMPLTLEKVRFLRRELPDATIEVDGGITPEVAKKVKEAGTDLITSAHYILAAGDPAAAYAELAGI